MPSHTEGGVALDADPGLSPPIDIVVEPVTELGVAVVSLSSSLVRWFHVLCRRCARRNAEANIPGLSWLAGAIRCSNSAVSLRLALPPQELAGVDGSVHGHEACCSKIVATDGPVGVVQSSPACTAPDKAKETLEEHQQPHPRAHTEGKPHAHAADAELTAPCVWVCTCRPGWRGMTGATWQSRAPSQAPAA
eukprot:CAMPEP_0115695902 /NCGR_PEP_ID=MMETSP0272-20121206/65006_1 /TAXON_ID=71861 /ORGANISM="Scrippsiella trochoidea, Strain CCMP3099" /LENGTH=191 /DNA_ID=CAMNT_0003136117 /DNA_START=1271 /DNA_END=1843 /DNA_ORIENTATION=+